MIQLLKVGSIEVPLVSSLGATQEYDRAPGGESLVAMKDGSARMQIQWQKIITTISARGPIPPGLEGVDRSAPLTLACIGRRAVTGAGTANVLTLPAARRTDAGYTPRGFARLDTSPESWVETAVSLAGDDATLTVVSGALQYRALYWPQFSAWVTALTETADARTATTQWTLEAREA